MIEILGIFKYESFINNNCVIYIYIYLTFIDKLESTLSHNEKKINS